MRELEKIAPAGPGVLLRLRVLGIGENHLQFGVADARMLLRRVVEAAPHDEPEQAEQARHDEGPARAPMKIEPKNDEGGESASNGGAAVEEGGGQAAFVFWEPLGDGFGGTGPVAGFGGAEQKAEAEETVKAASERGENGNDGIEKDGEGEAAFCADAIEEASEKSLADGIGDAKSDHDVGVIGVGPVMFELEVGGEEGKSLAVDVIDDGGSEEDGANPPAQVRDGARPCGSWGRRGRCGGHCSLRFRCWRGVLGKRGGRKQLRGVAVEIDGGVGMRAEDGSGSHGAEFAVEAGVNGLGFARVGNDAEDLLGFEDLLDGHGDGLLGNLVEIAEPAFADLLLAAGVIEIDDDVRIGDLEIGGRIVEGEMAIFADAGEGNIDGRAGDGGVDAANEVAGIGGGIEKVMIGDAGLADKALFEEFAEAGGMIGGQADVFVKMKEFDVLPGDVGSGGEDFEEFELRGAGGGDEAGVAASGNGGAESGGGLRGGSFCEGGLVVENLDNHLRSFPPGGCDRLIIMGEGYNALT